MRRAATSFAIVSSLALFGCGEDTTPTPAPPRGTTAAMDFTSRASLYAAPFPNDTRLSNGKIDLGGFDNGTKAKLVDRVTALLASSTSGFATTSAVYFQLTAAPGDLPDVHASVAPGSPIFLVDVDESSPDLGKLQPLSIKYLANGGPFGADNLLALLPYQGFPLDAKTKYAAFILKSLVDAQGGAFDWSETMQSIAAGVAPPGMSDDVLAEYRAAISAAKVDPATISAMTVFTTGDPFDGFAKVREAMVASPPKPDKAFVKTDDFDGYCVYTSTIKMPEYQEGDPPNNTYTSKGGEWVFDDDGNPVLQRSEEANFVVTVPKAAMPAKGYPIVIFSRTGGGGNRPLVDRGVQPATNKPATIPGTGPALYFATVGWAGASIDGPQGGLRNPTNGNEDFLIFNVQNPPALRDNIRQSAAELSLQAYILPSVTLDVSDCQGAGDAKHEARFDVDMMALMGHSMGATISPLALAYEPRFKAGLLSGAGGSWTENVIYKLEPLAIKPVADALLGLDPKEYDLNEWDPALNLFQWAGEPADPPVYSSKIMPRNILMMQGIVDTYILPPMANATSLSLGLDLAGDELDSENPGLTQFTPLGDLLDLSKRTRVGFPVQENIAQGVTAVVTQNPEDGIENGHEVVFQTEPPKHEYRCFLASLAKTGVARVPSLGMAMDPCD